MICRLQLHSSVWSHVGRARKNLNGPSRFLGASYLPARSLQFTCQLRAFKFEARTITSTPWPVPSNLTVSFFSTTRTRSMALRHAQSNGASLINRRSITQNTRHEHNHEDGHNANPNHSHDAHSHTHSHSHSIFGHHHSHSEESRAQGAEQIIAAWRGSGDRGSQITLIGLFCNVGLTSVKGIAGWYMHSASLLADAGHSLSDLLGDFVTLFCWRLSRRPPSERYPFGFAKFETIGATTISILLIGGALGIGFHSYHLLIDAFGHTAEALNPGPLRSVLELIASAPAPALGHSHVHGVDPNAAWFAAISVLNKEWLYRITKKVADEEKSPVLLANAIHHRSDAYSSVVAFVAIVGTWIFPIIPFDPIGGLIVSLVILRQGIDLLHGAWGDLTDAGVSKHTRDSLRADLQPLLKTDSHKKPVSLAGISDLRARRAGSVMFVDLTAQVPSNLTIRETSALEAEITKTLKKAKSEIAEVRVRFEEVDHHS